MLAMQNDSASKHPSTGTPGWKYAADRERANKTAGPAQCFEQQRVNTRVTYANCCSPTVQPDTPVNAIRIQNTISSVTGLGVSRSVSMSSFTARVTDN